jgi:hypothetical protein
MPRKRNSIQNRHAIGVRARTSDKNLKRMSRHSDPGRSCFNCEATTLAECRVKDYRESSSEFILIQRPLTRFDVLSSDE